MRILRLYELDYFNKKETMCNPILNIDKIVNINFQKIDWRTYEKDGFYEIYEIRILLENDKFYDLQYFRNNIHYNEGNKRYTDKEWEKFIIFTDTEIAKIEEQIINILIGEEKNNKILQTHFYKIEDFVKNKKINRGKNAK